MKKPLKIIGVLIAAYLIYSYIGPVRYVVDSISLFGSFGNYNYLSEINVASENY